MHDFVDQVIRQRLDRNALTLDVVNRLPLFDVVPNHELFCGFQRAGDG